jgi:reversibly glycosylated polypeptide/UDP-arabinopyranose mutase
MHALVVPSIRESSFHEFLNKWDDQDWEIIVVEDNPEPTFRLMGAVQHLCWKNIDEDLGDDAWIISHRDAAIRSYGFYKAYQMGAEYIFTLDDDCHPREGEDFIQQHIDRLAKTPRWTHIVPDQRTRGLPYHNLGTLTNVVLNVGLWEGIPDFDAVQVLNGEKHIDLTHCDRIMPRGQYFPMCGMNLCFKREITPLMYFMLMGEGHPYRRFDDIWAGIVIKKVCDHLGYLISVGEPFIHHVKASDPFVNLAKEAPGIGANEDFWQKVDAIPLAGSTPAQCMKEIGLGIKTFGNDYFENLGEAIVIWSQLF